MNVDNKVNKGLWIGKELSPNELLCINSYLYHGHQFELYIYDPIRNIPDSVIVKDANAIIPESEIFTYSSGKHRKSLSTFSNIFRYKLLFELGGWWSDMDAICVKPYDLDQEYVFMQEKLRDSTPGKVCSGIIKCPSSAPAMLYCYEQAKKLSENHQNLKWGEIGPALVAEAVSKFSLEKYVVPTNYFSPISYIDIPELFTASELPEETYSVHLFNEGWRLRSISKNGIYPKKSLYESLKKKYQVKNNYLKLIPEFIRDFRDLGIIQGAKVIKIKIWHMIQAFKKCKIAEI